jgi:nitrous oxidase accessory protein NosD
MAMLLAGLLLVAGCSLDGAPSGASSPGPSTPSSSVATSRTNLCTAVNTSLLAAVQRYVASYGAPLAAKGSTGSSNGSSNGQSNLQHALATAQQELKADGCDMRAFRTRFAAGLQKVQARGPVARAVLLRITASMTGTAVTTPSTVTVPPGHDLGAVLATLATGSTVRLRAGTYHLAESLVLLEGVTLRGAGRNRTTIVSTAGSAGLLVLTDGRVELRGLTLRHRGPTAGTLLMGGPSSSVVLTAARVTGARRDRSGSGGNGVMMTATAGAATHRGTTLQVTGTKIAGNDAAGILLTGGHVASIRGSDFTDNGQCGVCFSAASGGAVRGSRFTGNAVGVAVLDTARPAVVGDTFSGGLVGVQASGHGAPVVRAVRITRVTRAAMIFSGTSSGRVNRSTCVRVPYGIVVSPHAYPYLGTNSCHLARGG